MPGHPRSIDNKASCGCPHIKANEKRHHHLRLDPQEHIPTLSLLKRDCSGVSCLRSVCPQHPLGRLCMVSRVGMLGLFPIIVQQWMDPQAWKLHFTDPLELSCWQKTDWLNLNHRDLCDSAHSGWIGRNHQKEIGLWSVRALDYCRQDQCLSGIRRLRLTWGCSKLPLGMHVPLTSFSNLASTTGKGIYHFYLWCLVCSAAIPNFLQLFLKRLTIGKWIRTLNKYESLHLLKTPRLTAVVHRTSKAPPLWNLRYSVDTSEQICILTQLIIALENGVGSGKESIAWFADVVYDKTEERLLEGDSEQTWMGQSSVPLDMGEDPPATHNTKAKALMLWLAEFFPRSHPGEPEGARKTRW